ncbi:hypothetical protein PYK79_46210, partial [Streptomyces sp. ID05-04B]|nr:hypothetical protein [Streptomyces sp. ID05-04B]
AARPPKAARAAAPPPGAGRPRHSAAAPRPTCRGTAIELLPACRRHAADPAVHPQGTVSTPVHPVDVPASRASRAGS